MDGFQNEMDLNILMLSSFTIREEGKEIRFCLAYIVMTTANRKPQSPEHSGPSSWGVSKCCWMNN